MFPIASGPSRAASRPASRAPEVEGGAAEIATVLLTVAVAALWSAHVQHYQVFRLWDSDEYYALAEQLASGAPVTASAPYVYRVLTPWIVAHCCPDHIQRGFLMVNSVAGALGAVVLAIWLRRFVTDWRVRVLVTAAFVFEWHAPVRYVYYNPVYADALLLLFLPLGLIFVERCAERPSMANATTLVAITGMGVLAREMMLLVPFAALLHPGLWRRPRGAVRIIALAGPVAAASAATFVAHRGTHPRVAYSFVEAVTYHLQHKPLFSLVLPWFITFGPVIAIVLYDWRETMRFLRREQYLGAFLVACAVLAYIGGHDTERYLIWSAPVVYVLLGRSIVRHRTALASIGLMTVLVCAQLVSERVFWGIPDPTIEPTSLLGVPTLSGKVASALNRLFVINDFYWNLWSNFGSRTFHIVLLVMYALCSALIIAWMRSRSLKAQWMSKRVQI
jgi:hypothetical protein